MFKTFEMFKIFKMFKMFKTFKMFKKFKMFKRLKKFQILKRFKIFKILNCSKFSNENVFLTIEKNNLCYTPHSHTTGLFDMSTISELCCARTEFNPCSTQNYGQVSTDDPPPPLHEPGKEKGTLNLNYNKILSRKM